MNAFILLEVIFYWGWRQVGHQDTGHKQLVKESCKVMAGGKCFRKKRKQSKGDKEDGGMGRCRLQVEFLNGVV